MNYPIFRTEIEIHPGDAEHCGECAWIAPDDPVCCFPGWSDDGCDLEYRGDDTEPSRCPACLAAERASRERPQMLMKCPECGGDGCAGGCAGASEDRPGWIEVPR